MSMENVRRSFLTVEGLLITVTNLSAIVGFVGLIIVTRVYVLGMSPVPTATAPKK